RLRRARQGRGGGPRTGHAGVEGPHPLAFRKLSVVGNNGTSGPGGGNVTAIGGTAARGDATGAAALKSEPEAKLSPAEKLESLQWSQPKSEDTRGRVHAAERRAEAKAQGYEGEACGECQNFTLVRNGTCLKCNTCGSTTGCS